MLLPHHVGIGKMTMTVKLKREMENWIPGGKDGNGNENDKDEMGCHDMVCHREVWLARAMVLTDIGFNLFSSCTSFLGNWPFLPFSSFPLFPSPHFLYYYIIDLCKNANVFLENLFRWKCYRKQSWKSFRSRTLCYLFIQFCLLRFLLRKF